MLGCRFGLSLTRAAAKRLPTLVRSFSSSIPHNMASPTLMHLKAALDKLTPLELAESAWDNVGLMAEAPEPRDEKLAEGEARRVYLCIDCAYLRSPMLSPTTEDFTRRAQRRTLHTGMSRGVRVS